MWISDTSVRRPVLALVLNLLIVVFGLVSFTTLPLREYPDIDPPVVSVVTNYPGASASVVETRITQAIEDRIAGVEGIRDITSESIDGRSASPYALTSTAISTRPPTISVIACRAFSTTCPTGRIHRRRANPMPTNG